VSLNRPKTALVTSIAVAALIASSAAWAAPQQVKVVELKPAPQKQAVVDVAPVQERQVVEIKKAPRVLVEILEGQEAQKQAEEKMRWAFEMAQEFNFSPEMQLAATYRFRGGRLADRVLRASEELALTEAQESNIRDINRDQRREKIRRDADVEIAELELEEMMEPDVPNLDAIETHMRQIANLQVDARMANLRLDRAVKDVLTAEQIDQLDEMAAENMAFGVIRERQRNR